MSQHPSMQAAEQRAAARELAMAAELRIHRLACVAIVLIFGASSAGVGVLLAAGGSGRLQTPFFKGPAAVIPAWPWTWAGAIVTAGVCLIAGQLLQRWWLGIVGALGAAAWSLMFAGLSWVSMSYPGTGDKVAWYPTAVYGGLGGIGLVVAWWLNRLRRTQHHAG
jgi:hypothetical protein